MSQLKQECLRDGDDGLDIQACTPPNFCECCGYPVDTPGICYPCHKMAEEDWMAERAMEENR